MTADTDTTRALVHIFPLVGNVLLAWPMLPDPERAGALCCFKSIACRGDCYHLDVFTMTAMAGALGMWVEKYRPSVSVVDCHGLEGELIPFTHHITFTGKHWRRFNDWAVRVESEAVLS
jgi:hypothetical protein